MAQHLTWEALAPVTSHVFRVWTENGTEIDWAKHAWVRLRKAGLLDYEDEAGRCRAAVHYMALCDLYLDFAYVAWEEGGPVYYAESLSELAIPPSALAELLSRDPEWGRGPLDTGDWAAVGEALAVLVRKYRAPVVDALSAGGDVLASLWRSDPTRHYDDPIPMIEDYPDDIPEAVLNWAIGSGYGFTFRDYD